MSEGSPSESFCRGLDCVKADPNQVLLEAKAVKVSTAEHQRAEVLLDGLVQTLRRVEGERHIDGAIIFQTIAVDTVLPRTMVSSLR